MLQYKYEQLEKDLKMKLFQILNKKTHEPELDLDFIYESEAKELVKNQFSHCYVDSWIPTENAGLTLVKDSEIVWEGNYDELTDDVIDGYEFKCYYLEGYPIRLMNGETAEQWAKHLFEFDYCEECSGDVADHKIVPCLTGWFAECKMTNNRERLLRAAKCYFSTEELASKSVEEIIEMVKNEEKLA